MVFILELCQISIKIRSKWFTFIVDSRVRLLYSKHFEQGWDCLFCIPNNTQFFIFSVRNGVLIFSELLIYIQQEFLQ